MEETYEAYRYAADERAGVVDPYLSDGAVLARGSLEECQEAIAEALAAMDASDGETVHARRLWRLPEGLSILDYRDRRWPGLDDDVEAYHESDEEGCGGWAIRRVVG